MLDVFSLNKTDRLLYRALKNISDPTRSKLRNKKEEKDFMDGMAKTLVTNKLVGENDAGKWVLTASGLKELRELENHKRATWTLKISLFSITISILAIILSLWK